MDPVVVGAPAVLSPHRALSVKTLMCHGRLPEWVGSPYGLVLSDGAPSPQAGGEWPMVATGLANELRVTTSTVRRCFLAAQFFGNLPEAEFWTMAAHYLPRFKKIPIVRTPPPVVRDLSSPLCAVVPPPMVKDPLLLECVRRDDALDTYFDGLPQ